MKNLESFDEDDIAAVFSQLDERTQLAIYAKILERRCYNLRSDLVERDQQMEGMRHQIDLLGKRVGPTLADGGDLAVADQFLQQFFETFDLLPAEAEHADDFSRRPCFVRIGLE